MNRVSGRGLEGVGRHANPSSVGVAEVKRVRGARLDHDLSRRQTLLDRVAFVRGGASERDEVEALRVRARLVVGRELEHEHGAGAEREPYASLSVAPSDAEREDVDVERLEAGEVARAEREVVQAHGCEPSASGEVGAGAVALMRRC